MTPYERDVLEEIAEPGSVEGLRAGLGIMVALEWLQGQGYVTRGPYPKITDKGREALEGKSMIDKLTHCMCGCIYKEPDCPYCNKVTDKQRIEQLKAALKDQSAVSDRLAAKNEELEAKLAKAVEALADVYRLHLRRGPAWDHEPTKKVMEHARATLAELTGGKDE
jgi:hypothetical protein